jgi:acetyl esterase/lipase
MVENLAYGDHVRHRMDLVPVDTSGAPIVLFVHGGGFISGDKQVAPPFYANVGRYFAAHGILGACMNYRLAPAGGWPAASQDIDLAVQWLLDRGDLYGGDPRLLVVIGQSAGACHLATWLFGEQFEGGARAAIKGAVLMSGFYSAQPPLSAGQRAYFGDDADLYAQRSPLSMVCPLPYPVLVTMAARDPPPLRNQGLALVQALASKGVSAQVADFAGHNHVSPLMSLGSDRMEVGDRLRRFVMESCTTKGSTA